MTSVIKASLLLAVLIAVLSLALAFSGLHRSNPMLSGLLFIVPAILINLGCIFWGLKMSAGENGYLKQLLNAGLIGLGGGVLILLFSLLMLTVLLPDYLDESKDAAVGMLESMNMPEEQLNAQIERVEAGTPMSQARGGLIGTFFTSLIGGAIIGIFVRRK